MYDHFADMKKKALVVLYSIVFIGLLVAFILAKPKMQLGSLASKFLQRSSKETMAEGIIDTLHKDDFKHKFSKNEYTIRTADGKKIQFEPPKNSKKLAAGTKIRLNKKEIQILEDPPLEGQNGLNLVRLLIVRVATSSTDAFPKENAEATAFGGGPNSIKSYYERNSYHNIRITGDVFNSILLVQDGTNNNIDDVITALDPAINFNLYTHVLLLDLSSECSGSGFATIGPGTYDTLDGRLWLGVSHVATSCGESDFQRMVLHEFGHTIGLQHAGGLDTLYNQCPQSIPLDGGIEPDCVGQSDYTVMGLMLEDLSIPQRKILSSSMPIRSLTVHASGDYYLYPVELAPGTASNQYQELNIPATNGYYSLEFPAATPHHVAIRFVPAVATDYLLIDTILPKNPERGSFLSTEPIIRGLPAHSSFSDLLRSITIELLEINDDRVHLHIGLSQT